ncbi:MAG TPA: hypothetical protein VFG84_02250 [Gemmatimonadaceae bacterium]|nr:hypothetical protein [Gemmatimonadaceae bacterium]
MSPQQQPPRSLRHEYEVYVEREIEDYKDSISRSAILAIGDEAVSILRAQEQVTLDELLLCVEVDRIIMKRLRIPTYKTWRRRHLKLMEQYRRPEHWGLQADAPVVRAIHPVVDSRVLVAGDTVAGGNALYLAAHGCRVTAVETEPDAVERVISAAQRAGLTERLTGRIGKLDGWAPEEPLAAVVCTAAAFADLSNAQREQVIRVLQSATLDGGVHLVETIVAGQVAISLSELRSRYRGWEISVERKGGESRTFLARKGAA